MHSYIRSLFVLLALASPAAAQIITTVAGDGTAGFSGDGGLAVAARLNVPTGVAADSAGNVYVSDQSNHRVRKVDASGVITTVAGNGTAGFSGDGGLATAARLNAPLGLALDAAGNLYIADQLNHRIRKVDPSGVITTVAGNGTGGFSGDGGLATSASLQFASAALVDPDGNLWIADRNNQRIRRVDGMSGIITTVAGNGIQGFSGDGGPALSASFSSPVDIAVDASGNLFIADQLNGRIRRMDTAGIVTTVAGTGARSFGGDGGPAIDATFDFPIDVEVDARGNLFIADLFNYRVRRVDLSGRIETVAGNGLLGDTGDGGPATEARLSRPRAVALNPSGDLFLADLDNHRVRKVGLSPGSRIQELIREVEALGLPGRGGLAQLEAALRALSQDPPDVQAAIDSLQAFINFVNAQAGKKIPFDVAFDLIQEAQAIIEILSS